MGPDLPRPAHWKKPRLRLQAAIGQQRANSVNHNCIRCQTITVATRLAMTQIQQTSGSHDKQFKIPKRKRAIILN